MAAAYHEDGLEPADLGYDSEYDGGDSGEAEPEEAADAGEGPDGAAPHNAVRSDRGANQVTGKPIQQPAELIEAPIDGRVRRAFRRALHPGCNPEP